MPVGHVALGRVRQETCECEFETSIDNAVITCPPSTQKRYAREQEQLESFVIDSNNKMSGVAYAGFILSQGMLFA